MILCKKMFVLYHFMINYVFCEFKRGISCRYEGMQSIIKEWCRRLIWIDKEENFEKIRNEAEDHMCCMCDLTDIECNSCY